MTGENKTPNKKTSIKDSTAWDLRSNELLKT